MKGINSIVNEQLHSDLPMKQSKICSKNMGTITPVCILATCFLVFSTILLVMMYRLPALPEEQKGKLRFPRNVTDLKDLGSVLSKYQDNYYWEILIFISTTYIFVLLGFLFPFPVALAVVAVCSAVGATCCYLLVGFIGSNLLLYLFPNEIEQCRCAIHRYRNAMFFCICLLRICPLIPNWLVNVSSPIIEIPIWHFFCGTLVGVVPLSVVFVKAGVVLQELTDLGITSIASVYTLLVLIIASLLPFVFRKRIRNWFF